MKSGQTSTLNTISTGLFTGLIAVIVSISYASLIFSGELAPYLGHGIALAITSIVIVGLLQTFLSDSSYFVVQVDDDTAPVMVLFIGFLIASLPVNLSPEQLFTNVLAAILISTFIAGLTLTVVGSFKLGNLLQFLPYSAVGGYFAAVGWLLLVGTLNSLLPYELDNLDSVITIFRDTETLLRWLPALLIGAGVRWMSTRFSTALLLACTVVGSTLLFYLVAFSFGNSVSDLYSSGFLIGPLVNQPEGLFTPLTGIDWPNVEVLTLFDHIASIATISLIALLSFTLCISAVALSTRQELDPNKELKVSGVANMLSAVAGGLFALPSVSTSTLSRELHPSASKLIGLICALVALAVFYLGLDLIAYIPKMVLAALLFYIALGFLHEWLIKAYGKFGALEYSVIPIILIVSVLSGFLESVLFGIIAAIILFTINYSQIKVVKYLASGADLRSNLVRRTEQVSYLRIHGEKIRIFKLQGFLFFGTAGSVYKDVMAEFNKPTSQELQYIVLDFSQVLGVDSSATLNFERLAQRLKERNTYLILTSLKDQLLDKLIRGGFDLKTNKLLQEFLDIDQGLEWCENRILEEQRLISGPLKGVLELISGDLTDTQSALLETYLIKRVVKKGELLTNLGEASNEVYLLESCTASAYILDSDGVERRIDGAGRGAIYGEIGFFLNIPRTATVRADSPGDLYSLSGIALKRMESEQPQLAAAINRYMLKIVTERLASTTRSLRTVL